MGRHSTDTEAGISAAVSLALPHVDTAIRHTCATFRSIGPAPAAIHRPALAGRPAAEAISTPADWSHLPELGSDHHRVDPRGLLVRSLRFLASGITADGELGEDQIEFLQSLGRDFRKFGIEDAHYGALALAIRRGWEAAADAAEPLRHARMPRELADAVDLCCHVMAVSAAEDAAAGMPATVAAKVIAAERRCSDVIVVRVQMDPPRPWWPGQYVEVNTPYTPDVWRYLSPAIPFDEQGLAEFHIRGVGTFSDAAVRHTEVGDVWVVAQAYGEMQLNPQHDAILVAGSTGLAALRALILDLSIHAAKPKIKLFYGAQSPDELYELPGLKGFASAWDWLDVVPVVEHGDAGSAHNTATRTALDELPLRHGRVADVAVEYVRDHPRWLDADVLISGGPKMIAYSAEAFQRAGVDPAAIQYDRH
ncbi:flavohemoprotein [Corynebacterium heidelbergense]|uniref:Flavohemoprotein n=1 Tax=Corynebacterium heidelbergense TaxID=2055947 RepID=A0A364V4X2_9CORY|nr:flavohemoprotein [Corynebacterium heidelbergense]RAV31666.1 flavohemoprotein [Corynebacterium heidelbergense]